MHSTLLLLVVAVLLASTVMVATHAETLEWCQANCCSCVSCLPCIGQRKTLAARCAPVARAAFPALPCLAASHALRSLRQRNLPVVAGICCRCCPRRTLGAPYAFTAPKPAQGTTSACLRHAALWAIARRGRRTALRQKQTYAAAPTPTNAPTTRFRQASSPPRHHRPTPTVGTSQRECQKPLSISVSPPLGRAATQPTATITVKPLLL